MSLQILVLIIFVYHFFNVSLYDSTKAIYFSRNWNNLHFLIIPLQAQFGDTRYNEHCFEK